MIAITKSGLSLLLLRLLQVAAPVTAIYESQAGTFDWYELKKKNTRNNNLY